MTDVPPETTMPAPDGRDGESTTGTPRWVKVFGLVALVVVVLVVVVAVFGGGEHGPGRHSGNGGPDAPAGHTGPPPGLEHGG